MRHKCINCGVEWGGELDEDGLYSHGVCFDCCKEGLKPIYRKEQRSKGYDECFGNRTECKEGEKCKYYSICIENKIKKEE